MVGHTGLDTGKLCLPGTEEQVRVLVIDDDKFLSGIYVITLERAGIDIKIASSGEEGIAAVNEFRPHIIFLDVLMPGMDGFEVIKQLKQDERSAHVPVVFLTSLSQKEDMERGMSLGADDYLKKTQTLPIDSLGAVRKILKLEDEYV